MKEWEFIGILLWTFKIAPLNQFESAKNNICIPAISQRTEDFIPE